MASSVSRAFVMGVQRMSHRVRSGKRTTAEFVSMEMAGLGQSCTGQDGQGAAGVICARREVVKARATTTALWMRSYGSVLVRVSAFG
jgi:hypothetical protein